MRVVPVPLFADNYSYVLIDEPTNTAAVVDAAQPEVVESAIKSLVSVHQLRFGSVCSFSRGARRV